MVPRFFRAYRRTYLLAAPVPSVFTVSTGSCMGYACVSLWLLSRGSSAGPVRSIHAAARTLVVGHGPGVGLLGLFGLPSPDVSLESGAIWRMVGLPAADSCIFLFCSSHSAWGS